MRILFHKLKNARVLHLLILAILCAGFSAYATFIVFPTVQASQTDGTLFSLNSPVLHVAKEVFRQIDGVADFTAQAFEAVVSSTVRTEQQTNSAGTGLPEPIPVVSTQFPLSGVGLGKLIINAPLSLTNTLTASDLSYFATTSVAGLLTTDALTVDGNIQTATLTASGTVAAAAMTAGGVTSNTLTVNGTSRMQTLAVASEAAVENLTVANQTQLATVVISGTTTLADLVTQGTADFEGLLTATGGVATDGADVNLAGGKLYASNVVYEVLAGEGVTVTGSSSAPVIAVDFDNVVTEVNGETGEIDIRAGTDIRISSLRISNDSTLSSVRGRGGCSGCITDTDVSDVLTVTGGTINDSSIGLTTAAAAAFTNITVGTTTATTSTFAVYGTGVSTFGGGINLESGCFSIGGVCVASAASTTTYIGLGDTPSTLMPGAVQYVNATGSALVQSNHFIYDGASLALGTTTPVATLTVEGDVSLTGTTSVTGTFTSSGDVSLNANLAVAGTTTISQGANVGGPMTLSDTLAVTGSSTFSSNLVVGGLTILNNNLSVDGDIALQNGAAAYWYDTDGSNYAGFRASSSLSSDTVWTLPVGDGNSNEVLVTDGSGQLRFAPVSAIGGGVTDYVGLSDTPASLASGTVPYVNASGTALVHSTNLQYDGTYFSIGPAVPSAELTVDGAVDFIAADGSVGFMFDDATQWIGIGTNAPTETLTLRNGSFLQSGGASGDLYTPTSERVVAFGDDIHALEVYGAYAYAVSDNTGDEFHVIDITDIALPVEVGATDLPSFGNDVVVSGKYAYVVSGFAGDDFHVIDISDSENPVEIESINLSAAANGVAVKGNYAFVVTDGASGNVQVIDISNPFNVASVASTSLPTNAKSIDIKGNFIYVATEIAGDDFYVIDISDPLNPTQRDSINLPDSANVVTVSESGTYAYVGTSASGDDLHVIDISDPDAISEVNSLELNVSVEGLTLVGEMLYVTSLTAGQDLHVVDISSPAFPVLTGGVDLGSGNVLDVVVVGKYAYAATTAGINVVDISGAQLQSVLTSSFQTGNMFVTGNSDLAGNLAVRGSLYSGADVQSTGVLKVFGSDASYILGNLSVGTTSTSTGLLVDGAVQATNLLGGATNLTTDINGNIIRDPSDARLKKNITDVDDALEILIGLRGVRYQWRDPERFGMQTEIGFIAQEVDLVLPEVVRKGGDYWSINTRNILAVVVEAVKEVWETVQGNENKIQELENRIFELESGEQGAINEDDETSAETEGEDAEEDTTDSEEENTEDSEIEEESEAEETDESASTTPQTATSTPETVEETDSEEHTETASSTSETEEEDVEVSEDVSGEDELEEVSESTAEEDLSSEQEVPSSEEAGAEENASETSEEAGDTTTEDGEI